MNKIILACFQDDGFSLIFEPLVLELLMIRVTCEWMHICLLFTGEISPNRNLNSKLKCFLEVFNCQIPMFGF